MNEPATSCLDPDRAIDFVERRLAGAERAVVEAHVAGCADCRNLLAIAATGTGGAMAATVESSERERRPVADEAYCSSCGNSFSTAHDVCPNDGARLTKLVARPDPLIGRVLDERYEVRAALGEGGMGTVYRGWQLSVDREVAIKVIHPKLANDRDAVKRFLRESRLSSRLSQPAIVSVHDCGQTDDGVLYIAMELVRGQPLATELASRQPLAPKRIASIGIQLCDALAAAHGQGIIHRDLKPGNIMVLDDPPGRDLIKVLDFGLAKSLAAEATSITQTRAIVGTPLYMPPEQVESESTDQRSDLYSLGCILYQLAAGRPPFLADKVSAILEAHVHQAPPPLPASVPPPLARLIAQLLEKAPADRPASAAVVRTAIEHMVERGELTSPLEPTPEPASGPASSPSFPASARRTRLGLAMIGIVIGLAAVVFMTRARDPGTPLVVPAGDAAEAVHAGVDAVATPLATPIAPTPPVDAPAATIADAAPTGRRVVAPRDAGVAPTTMDADRPAPDAGKPTIEFLPVDDTGR